MYIPFFVFVWNQEEHIHGQGHCRSVHLRSCMPVRSNFFLLILLCYSPMWKENAVKDIFAESKIFKGKKDSECFNPSSLFLHYFVFVNFDYTHHENYERKKGERFRTYMYHIRVDSVKISGIVLIIECP